MIGGYGRPGHSLMDWFPSTWPRNCLGSLSVQMRADVEWSSETPIAVQMPTCNEKSSRKGQPDLTHVIMCGVFGLFMSEYHQTTRVNDCPYHVCPVFFDCIAFGSARQRVNHLRSLFRSPSWNPCRMNLSGVTHVNIIAYLESLSGLLWLDFRFRQMLVLCWRFRKQHSLSSK